MPKRSGFFPYFAAILPKQTAMYTKMMGNIIFPTMSTISLLLDYTALGTQYLIILIENYDNRLFRRIYFPLIFLFRKPPDNFRIRIIHLTPKIPYKKPFSIHCCRKARSNFTSVANFYPGTLNRMIRLIYGLFISSIY